MLYLGFLLFVVGLFALPISILVLIIRVCLKKALKGTKRVIAISIIGIVAGFIIMVVSPMPEDESDIVVKTKEESNNAEEIPVMPEENTTVDEENYNEEDWVLGSAKADEYYEDNYTYGEWQTYPDDSDDFSADYNTDERVNIEDMKNYVFPVSDYPYQNKKEAKDMIKIYEKAMTASAKDFVYLEEVSKGGVLTEKKIHYKKTINAQEADYKYYGKLNRSDEPDGTGVLFEKWYDDSYENESICFTAVYYIGEFNNGFKDGYGIEYNVDIGKGYFGVNYEGKFKNGEYNGDGILYYYGSGTDIDIDIDYRQILSDRAYGMSSSSYDVFFPQIDGGKLVTYPLIFSKMRYDGDFKNGEFHGKGKLYAGYDDEGILTLYYEGEFQDGDAEGKGTEYFTNGAIKYQGEFKNGEYNGKGTLYDVDGNVLHKGKFKNGDVA